MRPRHAALLRLPVTEYLALPRASRKVLLDVARQPCACDHQRGQHTARGCHVETGGRVCICFGWRAP